MRTFRKSLFRHRMVRALPLILAVSTGTFIAERQGWLRGMENAAFDSFFRLGAPRLNENIRLVTINQADYDEKGFRGACSVDANHMAALLADIASCGPKLIAVDIDTSAPVFADMKVPDTPKIVWARNVALTRDHLKPLRVLGGKTPSYSGLAVVPEDPDATLRRYDRCFDVRDGDTDRRLPSFSWAVTQAAAGRLFPCEEKDGHHSERYLRRHRFPEPIAAWVVSEGAKEENWRLRGPLKDKIVLLGGTYDEAQDLHATADGWKSGLEIVAEAIACEREGRPISPAREGLMLLVEVLSGLALVAIHHRYPVRQALLISLIAIPLLAGAGSLAAFLTLACWANLVPVMIAVLVHQLYDHARAYRKLYVEAARKESASA